MNKVIYISGITGMLLLVTGLIGLFMEFAANKLIVIAGLVMLGLVFFPLNVVQKKRQNKKIDEIIRAHAMKNQKKGIEIKEIKSEAKGWDMNTSPFRGRRSGLTWGGGNIKAAEAQRGSRRSFLK